jgi:hypothetical protein
MCPGSSHAMMTHFLDDMILNESEVSQYDICLEWPRCVSHRTALDHVSRPRETEVLFKIGGKLVLGAPGFGMTNAH